MNRPLNTPGNFLHKEQGKDNEINGYIPDTSFIEVIKADAEQHLQAFEKADKERQNPFPVEVFPKQVQQIIHSANKGLSFPVDFLGVSILYTVALAVGNTHRIQVRYNWIENAVLYFAIVGQPGTNKSHPLSFALKPIQARDNKTYAEYETLKQEYDEAVSLPKKEREQQDEPIKPIWQKFLVSDFTPEALAEKHKFNQRGVGVCTDELAAWVKNFQRYHKGGDQEFWLSVWSSKPINIDRKTSDPVYLPLPFIPVIGSIQTGILGELAKDGRGQNGFIDRLLFAMPGNLQKPYWSETEISSEVIDTWERIVSNLLELPLELDDNSNPEPELLKFTPEARKEFIQWYNTNVDLLNKTENEVIKSIYSKADMSAARLALVLEMMRWACGDSDKKVVGIGAVQGALKLVEYFRKTALKVREIISNPLDGLAVDKGNWYQALPDCFTTGEAIEIANSYGIPKRTLKQWLTDGKFFKRIRHGNYEKHL